MLLTLKWKPHPQFQQNPIKLSLWARIILESLSLSHRWSHTQIHIQTWHLVSAVQKSSIFTTSTDAQLCTSVNSTHTHTLSHSHTHTHTLPLSLSLFLSHS